MIKYRHKILFSEGAIDSDNFKEIATLSYEGLLPSAPSPGLLVAISYRTEFEIKSLKYIQSEEIYESCSHIDFYEMESSFKDFVPRGGWIARYIKDGFKVDYADPARREEIELAAENDEI